jgi:hypothetical protein
MLTTALMALLLLQDGPTPPARVPRYRPPTDAERVSAYANPATEAFVGQARRARFRVDSTLSSYRATSYERLTLGGSLGPTGPERTLGRRETVGEVTWSSGSGAHISLAGRRRARSTGFALPNPVGDQLVPVPWYPGMDALWLPSSNGPTGRNGRGVEADTTNLVHPLSVGSESYYTFSLGDSAVVALPDGERIVLRELRARPRQPRWNLSVGSYWFDVSRMQLVRAVYRLSVPYDVWTEVDNALAKGEKGPPWYVKFFTQPLRAELQAVTLEYGLHENRFWLPRTRRVDGTVKAGPAQLAVTIEQGFRYSAVNAVREMPTIPAANLALRAAYDSVNADWQRLWRDRRSLRTRDDTLAWERRRAVLDSAWARYSARSRAQAEADCAATGTRYQTGTRLGGALTTRVAVPCDSVALANAPELAGGLFAERAEVYASTMSDAVREALGLDVQAAFAPQRVTTHAGLEYLRYNRVEALSVGGALRQQLGAGWSWEANARGSFGDRQLNGELLATRTNGGSDMVVAGYRRLVQSDDYGFAFGPFASVQNFVSALDEQFYHRAAGAEVVRRRSGRGAGGARTELRLFGEWQEGVGTSAQLSLPWLFDRTRTFDASVLDTLPHERGAAWGASLHVLASRGADQEGWRVGSAVRLEAAGGAWQYARAAADLSLARALPGNVRARVAVSGGSSAGTLPTHRLWNVGGWQTVRGVTAGTLRGDAFWMTRAETIWWRPGKFQPGLFADAGWAGARRDIARADGARLSVGGGVGLYGLPIRVDAARALEPGGRWRVDLYAPIRF